MAEPIVQVYNADIVLVADKFCRYAEEAIKSVSSGLSGVTSHDMTRLDAYLKALTFGLNYVVAQPQLDLPETSPRLWAVASFPTAVVCESDEINHVQKLLFTGYNELVNSQSARLPSGLLTFDESRIRAIIEKVQRFLTDFVAQATPLDLPESSPSQSVTGPGKTGV
jgi:hypothetical protein